MRALLKIFLFLLVPKIIFAGPNHNVSGWAWSENIGWISFNSISDNSSQNYGVHIDPDTGYISGYAWSENLGWISFERADTKDPPLEDPCESDKKCIAKVENPKSIWQNQSLRIKGWARVLSVKDNPNAGGWDGWIRFDNQSKSEVLIDQNGDFHGWAWSAVENASSSVLGWISFNYLDEGAGGSAYQVKLDLDKFNRPPVAQIGCDATNCPGGTCSGQWRAYQPTASPPSCTCIFTLKNNSYDPDNNIIKTEWRLNGEKKLECNSICDYTLQGYISPGTYTVQLIVTDARNLVASTSAQIEIKKEARANFMCSLDGTRWQECDKIKLTEGEIIYVRDDPSLPLYSIPSEGASGISQRIWEKTNREGNFVKFVEVENATTATTTLQVGKQSLRLYIKDTNQRCDEQIYQIKVKPHPPWHKEIPPVSYLKAALVELWDLAKERVKRISDFISRISLISLMTKY